NKNQYVVHNAIDIKLVKRPARIVGSAFNVLMVCSLKTYKGLFEFFAVAENLLHKSVVRFTLVLNAEPAEFDVFFKGVSIPRNVTLFSRQADVTPFYNQ